MAVQEQKLKKMFSQIINNHCLGHLVFAGCPKVMVPFNLILSIISTNAGFNAIIWIIPIEISEQRTKRSIASTVDKTDRRSSSRMNVNGSGSDFFLYLLGFGTFEFQKC